MSGQARKDVAGLRKAARKEAKALSRSGAGRLAEAARKREAAEAAARKAGVTI